MRTVLLFSLLLLTACSGDSLPDQINVQDKTKEQLISYVSISVLLYMCGHYGQSTNEVDAPLNHSDYYAKARLILSSIHQQRSDIAKVSVEEFEPDYLKTLNDAYLKGGPQKLRKDIERAFTRTEQTYLPNWISSCSDVFNYSGALINQAS